MLEPGAPALGGDSSFVRYDLLLFFCCAGGYVVNTSATVFGVQSLGALTVGGNVESVRLAVDGVTMCDTLAVGTKVASVNVAVLGTTVTAPPICGA